VRDEKRQARKIDGKDTSVTGQAAGRNATVIDFGAPPAHRQPETEPGAIRIPLFERPKQIVDRSVGKSATFVFYVDSHTVGGRTAAQGDVGPWPRELEGVLKQVRDDGSQYRSVSIDSRCDVPSLQVERESACFRLQSCGVCEFFDEFGEPELTALANVMTQAHISY